MKPITKFSFCGVVYLFVLASVNVVAAPAAMSVRNQQGVSLGGERRSGYLV